MSGIFGQEWFLWAAALVLGFPLLAVALGELGDRLERHGRPIAAVVRGLRNLVLPFAVVFAFATQVLGFGFETIPARVAQTALWIALLYTSLTALNVFLFEHAESTSWRARAPRLFVDLLRLLLVFVGGALVLSIVWNRNLGGLLAALGVGSIVLGLALQDTLGSLMSGIALLFERPFQIGDWIKVGGNEGEVIEVNWRSVHLRTRERDLLVVPNSILAKETIVNTGRPTPLHAERIAMAFSLAAPPNRVREVLTEVAASLPHVLSEPPPKVEVMEFGEDRIHYETKLYMTHLRGIPKVRSEFAARAWYAAQRAGLALPVPVRTVQAAQAPVSGGSERLADTLRSLAGFASLDESARKTLTGGARILHYAAGETALGQGEPYGALCVVSDGRARMSLRTKAGAEREVMELHPGEAFGEGALLKGERSPVTVTALSDLAVVALDTAALEAVLEDHPGLATELGQLVEARRRAVGRVKHAAGAGGTEVRSAL